jgi:hypothetical protein
MSREVERFSSEVLQPLCRRYAKEVLGDKPADAAYSLLCSIVFQGLHGYWPKLRAPRSFVEKIWHRCMFERDPCWTLLSDKLRSRDYVVEKVGERHLVPLLWTGRDPGAIPFHDLPTRFVIKPNHGSGQVLFVREEQDIDRSAIQRKLTQWLGQNYCEEVGVGMEWGYKHIEPCVLVETFLGDEAISPPDYKFFCFSGRTEFVMVAFGRYSAGQSRAFMDRDFNPAPFTYGPIYGQPSPPRPSNYVQMLEIAERISDGFGFLRVDLYTVGQEIYVGELTCYPGGGYVQASPTEYDFLLGRKWDMSSR